MLVFHQIYQLSKNFVVHKVRMIIAVNIEKDYNLKILDFNACDVSWISKYKTEKEIIVARGSRLNMYPSQIYQIKDKQWIVGYLGDEKDVSFENVFLRQ